MEPFARLRLPVAVSFELLPRNRTLALGAEAAVTAAAREDMGLRDRVEFLCLRAYFAIGRLLWPQRFELPPLLPSYYEEQRSETHDGLEER